MAVKTITVTEEAYNGLKGLKRKDESFSKLLIRLTKGRNTLKEMLGALPDIKLSVEDIRKIRSNADKSFERRRHVYS